MKTKIQLIRPPLDPWYDNLTFTNMVSVPIGLCLIAKKLQEFSSEVEIIDGLNLNIEEIDSLIKAEMVGVTELYSQHLSALEILRRAKEKGATTVIGGPNVNYLAERILENHSFVDYAIIGDGEEAMLKLVKGEKLSSISNLVYRQKNQIIKNSRKEACLNTIFDLDCLSSLKNFSPNNIFPISSIRGCLKAEQSGRCTFCSIEHRLRVMRPELIWQQIALIHERYGVNFFYETGDTFLFGNFIERLLATKPKTLNNIVFRVYTRPEQITEKNLELLCQLGIKEIFIGTETLSNKILALAQKNYQVTDIKKAVDLVMKKKDLILHLPFLYGLPGETINNMNKTYNYAKKVAQSYSQLKIVTSFPVPLAGSQLFERLRFSSFIKKEYAGNLDSDDFFDYQQLARIQTKHFTNVTYEQLEIIIEKTKALINQKGLLASFGVNQKTLLNIKNQKS
ncbi:MAG: B12-binding domain-containing radical SAM protein [Planctomycetes bacterium]|jgi:radical SAM superfamily enzyme YgiQ (UPF0313 family)|nr:B12-binding domain-containing radical SAM protein [Planctomycetota bacterium]